MLAAVLDQPRSVHEHADFFNVFPLSKPTPSDAIDRKMEDRYNTSSILLYFRCQFHCISIWNGIKLLSWNIFLTLDTVFESF